MNKSGLPLGVIHRRQKAERLCSGQGLAAGKADMKVDVSTGCYMQVAIERSNARRATRGSDLHNSSTICESNSADSPQFACVSMSH